MSAYDIGFEDIDEETQLEILADHLLKKHGLEGWTFKWNNRKRAFGLCSYSKKQIQLSRAILEAGEPAESMAQTLLHEVAHALAGPKAGHGPEWRRIAKQIGMKDPQRCKVPSHDPNYTWGLKCPGCEKYFRKWFRKPSRKRNYSCSACSGGTYNEQYKLELVKL